MEAMSHAESSGKAKNITLWVLQSLTAAVFLMSGFPKFLGLQVVIEAFDKIGLGQWFRFFTGGVEVVAAVLLLIPRLSPVGALLLVCTMVGAVIAHLTVLGGSPVGAIILLLVNAVILWGRRDTLKRLLPGK